MPDRTIEHIREKIAEAMFHDKKADGDFVTVTMVSEVGSFELKKIACVDLIETAKDCLEGLKI